MGARQLDSGATVEIFVETDTNRVGLMAADGGDLGKMVQLSVFAHALYDELLDLSSAAEVDAKDRERAARN